MNKTYAAAGLTSWRGGRNSPHSILGAGGKLGETCHELSIAGVCACARARRNTWDEGETDSSSSWRSRPARGLFKVCFMTRTQNRKEKVKKTGEVSAAG